MATRRDLGALGRAFPNAGVYFPTGKTLRPRIWRTGIDVIDVMTGLGGLPEGRVVVAQGPQAAGKTTLVGHLAATVLDAGGYVLYLDHERKLDQGYYAQIGVALHSERFVIGRPQHIEEAFSMIQAFGLEVRGKWDEQELPILVVWDSIHAIVAKRRFDKGFDEGNYSPEAGAYNDGFKKVVPMISDYRMLAVFISQQRMDVTGFRPVVKIGIGNAVGHAASIVLNFKAARPIGPATGRTGNLCRVVVAKNQMAAPWTHGEFPLHFMETEEHPMGVDMAVCAMTAAKMVGMAARNGSIEFETTSGAKALVRGLAGVRQLMASSPVEFSRLREIIIAATSAAKLPRIGDRSGDEDEDSPSAEETDDE